MFKHSAPRIMKKKRPEARVYTGKFVAEWGSLPPIYIDWDSPLVFECVEPARLIGWLCGFESQ